MIRLLRHGKPVAVLMVIIAFSFSTPVSPLFAALVETESTHPQQASEVRDRLTEILAREDVRLQLRLLGIDPVEAEARVACLSTSELEALSGRIDWLPAGGMTVSPPWYLVVIPLAIVVVVLVILGYLGHWAYQKAEENRIATGAPPVEAKPRGPTGSPYPSETKASENVSVDSSQPWTGKWKIANGFLAGSWALKQEGDRVSSIHGSDYRLDATVSGGTISGRWSEAGTSAGAPAERDPLESLPECLPAHPGPEGSAGA